jgi:adenylosuccinate lyase
MGGTCGLWLEIETAVLTHQRKLGIVPPDQGTDDLLFQLGEISEFDFRAIIEHENRTRHDVVAFLDWVRKDALNGHYDGRWLHFGLTSSDVVDTAQGMRFREIRNVYLDTVGVLINELNRLSLMDTPILARTHGQPAEVMTMQARVMSWITTLATPAADLSRASTRMAVCKLSGPVGTYNLNQPELEIAVAKQLSLRPHGPGATQIASRAPLAAWANSAALFVSAIGKIAMDLRLMHLTGILAVPMKDGQVGSSSMAHKRNPIGAEQLAGMGRIARGYADMLQPLDTWLERDISQSSVERIAVPGLWHIVLHSIKVITELLVEFQIDEQAAVEEIKAAGVGPLVASLTLNGIMNGMSVDEARRWALGYPHHARPEAALHSMRNYPNSGTR